MIYPKILKLILATLLFICLLPMPYGYYELVRFVMLIGFCSLAYQEKLKDNKKEMLFFLILALLFQPFFKVALGRALWNVVDVVVGIYLLSSLVKMKVKDDYQKKIEKLNKKNYFE